MKKILFLTALLCIISVGTSYAQGCSVCSKTASELGDGAAKGMNKGILFLAALPLTILGTISVIWWRKQQQSSEDGSIINEKK